MKRKHYLRNANGVNYEILSRRKSEFHLGRNDYLVAEPTKGYVTTALGWVPERKTWDHGIPHGFYRRNPRKLGQIKAEFKKGGLHSRKLY